MARQSVLPATTVVDVQRVVRARGGGERWFGFEAVRPIGALREELTLVPLVGHALG